MISEKLFTSTYQNWETPPELFNSLNEIFNFTVDAAADAGNTKCTKYFSEDNSALTQPWKGNVVFCNCPYDQQDAFIEKAIYELSTNNVTSVFLIPSRTETKRWQKSVFPFSRYIVFLKGRLKFSGSKNSAPFPSAIVVFTRMRYNLSSLQSLGFII